jgi:hypothetical protein
MMAALLLSLASAVPTLSDTETDYFVEKFRAACMQGRVSFPLGQIREIPVKSLVSDIRPYYGHIPGARYYELKMSVPAYLVTWERKPAGTYYTRGCAMMARDLPYIKTWEKALNTRFSPRDRSRILEMETRNYIVELPLPEEGKKIAIDRVTGGRYVALQVSAMSNYENRDWKATPSVQRSPINQGTKK